MYSLIDKYKKLVYEFSGKNPYILKILPIWNKYWKKSHKLLHGMGLSKSQIFLGKDNALNECIITFFLAKLVLNNISYSFVPLISIKKVDILPKEINTEIHQLEKIPYQKYYLLKVKKLQECNFINKKNTDIVVFQLQWGLFIAYKLFGFIHGDILGAPNNNLLCDSYKLPGKNSLIVRHNHNIWHFPIIGEELPVIVLYDYGYSNFYYKDIQIYTKIPYKDIEKSTSEEKWILDIEGYNDFLKKFGIERKIPKIPMNDYYRLLEGFDKYKISLEEFRKIDKSKYLLFDGNTKKF